MSSARSLTGGTNDVNPQPLRCTVSGATTAQTGAWQSVAATVALPIPVQRLSTGGRAQVMEILGWSYDLKAVSSSANIAQSAVTICISSRSNGTTIPTMGVADPYTVDFLSSYKITGALELYDSGKRDLTDGAGHGVLFGMDTMYIQVGMRWISASNAGSATPTANICIWYRWKNVGFSEYVGMVTSS